MLKYDEFVTEVVKILNERLGKEYNVRCQKVIKNNDVELDGVSIMKKEVNIAPTIYLNNYYDDYVKGQSIDEIIKNIIMISENSICPIDSYEDIFKFDSVKEKIIFKLVGRENNSKRLEEIVHTNYLDMAVTFYILVNQDDNGVASIAITNTLLKKWNISVPELEKIARVNTPKIMPVTIHSMLNIVSEMMSDEIKESDDFSQYINEPEDMMYIITNSTKVSGASCILYDNVLDEFARKYKLNKVFILPSSIHECIVLTQYNESNGYDLREMVKEVNSTVVDREEILSYSIYVYDTETKEIEILE